MSIRPSGIGAEVDTPHGRGIIMGVSRNPLAAYAEENALNLKAAPGRRYTVIDRGPGAWGGYRWATVRLLFTPI